MIRSVLCLLLLLLTACEEQFSEETAANVQNSKPLVLTTNYPLFFFTSEIAGDAVDVRLPKIDGDPALWVPGASDISHLQAADLIVLNGAGYESWLTFTTLPSDRLIDTTADLQDLLLPIEKASLHQHGPEGEHSHAGTAFTTWLNPRIAIEQARVIAHELSVLVPTQTDAFKIRLVELEKRLIALDQSFEQAFSGLGDQPLIFSHPVYQYLQRRYGLNGRSLHWEPDNEPGVKEWLLFQDMLMRHPAKLMLWEGQPTPSLSERLLDQGIQSVVFDPVANRPEDGDYFSLMTTNLNRLSALLPTGSLD